MGTSSGSIGRKRYIYSPHDQGLIGAVDGLSLGVIEVDFAQHQIHDGLHYYYTDCITLASAATQVYMLTVPNTTTRNILSFNLTRTGSLNLDLAEAGDRAGTTLQTTFNNDRDSSNTAGMTIHKDISGGTTDGTLILVECAGSNKQAGIVDEHSILILKTDTKYVLTVTSNAANNDIGILFDWYEVVP